ncbi:MAG: isoleucine--tRNA ligase [bacterium]
MSFKKIDPKLKLNDEEKQILSFWKKEDIFNKTLGKKAKKGNFVFYEGPPTANGQPGLHHVLARAFKDLFARYKTMEGYHVERKAGWDTHGLPVELQVEKELGISGKNQIENIVQGNSYDSIEKFNKLCKESVWKYKGQWEEMTERMGYWVDMKNPYITYEPKYIESVWNIIGEIEKKGLLYKSYKIVPYCPRCGTALSSHEVAQGYQNVREESVYVLFKSSQKDFYFLVWTTTPWTLSGNIALAFGEDVHYSLVESDGIKFVIAKSRLEQVMGDGYKIIKEYTGDDLLKELKSPNDETDDYEPLYSDGLNFAEAGDKGYKLIIADYVSDQDGTGIVHIAPAFGQEDYEWGFEKNGIKILKTVDEQGIALAGAGKGKFVKDADADVKDDLKQRGLLFKTEQFSHDYPFCWRCDSPLLYYAKDSWYIATTKVGDELLANNEEINWNPKHLKHGRFGNWLENNVDWALSRDRYWGTPLPIWECEVCKKYKVVTSLKEIGDIEPHRPYVDVVEFECACGGKMRRTPEVIDCWFDSGSMPYAQYHYPFENKNNFESQFPADFICEAVDQTRGWFYTLLAISTLISNKTAYRNVISTGLVLDDKGQKMSKSKGNIVVPDVAFEKYGADVIRFFMYSVNKPEEQKLFIDKEVLSVSRNLFMTLWNVYSFFMLYAEIDKFQPRGGLVSENVLDKWIIAKLNELIKNVNNSMAVYDSYKSANDLIDFVQELSTWYVRRSRRRFWKSESDTDKNSAYETLYLVLRQLSVLLAPFAPMFAETLYIGLKQPKDPISVHLCDYPNTGHINKDLLDSMTQTRRIVEEGLSLRMKAGIKVRQPLSELTYQGKKLEKEFEEIIREEVNIKSVKHLVKKADKVMLTTNITKALANEGLARELVRKIQDMRKKADFNVADRIEIYFETKNSNLSEIILNTWNEYLTREILATKVLSGIYNGTDYDEDTKIEENIIWIGLKRVR